jgi:antitoxin VapB
MKKKTFTERELLEDLDAHTAHADELAPVLPQELTPLERLKGSVKRYERPTDPVWDEYFDSEEGVTEDFAEDRDQPLKGRE